MDFLFRDRGQGKRQVKVSQDVVLLEDNIPGEESSDDSEYLMNVSGLESVGSSTSGSDDEDKSSEEGEDDSNDENEDDACDEETREAAPSKRQGLTLHDLLALCNRQSSEIDANVVSSLRAIPKICGVCLGQNSNDANEIVECDSCGVAVHEGCYGILCGAQVETASVSSDRSSASTEPWFCDACRAGLKNPPRCELCPVVAGVYKETDVGRWVHLICALYVRGVAFGDPEHLRNVTLFEMNYALWGRKACSICSLEDIAPEGSDLPADHDLYQLTGGARLARTGVCIECDAGLCKATFHVTCAQTAGLLSEPEYLNANQVETVDMYLAHCKLHSDKTIIKERKRAFLVQLAQANQRRKEILDRQKCAKMAREHPAKYHEKETADNRIRRKLLKSSEKYLVIQADKMTLASWRPTQKLPRLPATSPAFVMNVQRGGAVYDEVDLPRQRTDELRAISVIEGSKKPHVALAFSTEFVAHYEERNRRIPVLRKKVEAQLEESETLVSEQRTVNEAFEKAVARKNSQEAKHRDLRDLIAKYGRVLKLGGRSLPIPVLRAVESQTSLIPTTPAIVGSSKSRDVSKSVLNRCGPCGKGHDQHLITQCERCKVHYHLGCLKPPLTRMPKKSRIYGWVCAECGLQSDEEINFDPSPSGNRKRRQAASRSRHATMMDLHEAELLVETPSPKRKKTPAKVKDEEKRKKKKDKGELTPEQAAAKAERKRQKKERRREEKRQKMLTLDLDERPPITLKIKRFCPVDSELQPETNGHNEDTGSDSLMMPSRSDSAARRRSSSGRDVRTRCDKCDGPGDNASLVRCDECQRCFHLMCLIPPVKKSPKVPGYSWHCVDCDPSDRDSDWHLD